MMETKPQTPEDRRRTDLAKIHVAKKELRLNDDEYRDLLWSVCRVRSAKDLDFMGRQKLLIQLQSLGWRPAPAAGKSGRSHWKPPAGSQGSKILALWLELKRKGKLHTPTDEALFDFIKDMTGVDRPDWLTADQANDVIEGLKAWLMR